MIKKLIKLSTISILGFFAIAGMTFAASPEITSNGSGASASVNADEKQTAVTTVAATDPENDTITYGIVGGADSAKFSIDSPSGILAFIAAPDFEDKQDMIIQMVFMKFKLVHQMVHFKTHR